MLTVLLFIREFWPHQIQYEWRNVGVTNKLLGYLEYSHSSLPHWNWVYHVPSPLKWRFCQVLISTRLGMTWGCLSSYWCDELGYWDILVLKNVSPAGPSESVSFHFSSPEVVQTQGIQEGQLFHLVNRLDKGFSSSIPGFTYVICAFSQHLSPCYPYLINY